MKKTRIRKKRHPIIIQEVCELEAKGNSNSGNKAIWHETSNTSRM